MLIGHAILKCSCYAYHFAYTFETMTKYLSLLLLLLLLNSCYKQTKPKHTTLNTIAFGSCNKEYLDQSYWPVIANQNPDLWIWLGDNIYADTADMEVMADKYQQQKTNPYYQRFLQQVPVTGVWDDHDYGVNDGDRTFSQKDQAKDQFLSFLNIPNTHTVNKHPGIYRTEVFGLQPQQVKIFHLDTRYFQDPLIKTPKGSKKNYVAQPDGQILGSAQWQWLTHELNQSTANINIIASSIQVIAEDHRYEMWSNFPNQRKKLLDLIVSSGVNNPIILSGDRHLSEISKINWQDKELIDITASGLTHSFSGTEEYNRHRIDQLITTESFSVLEIDWVNKLVLIKQIDMQGTVINKHPLKIIE